MKRIMPKLGSNQARLSEWMRRNANVTRDEGDFAKVAVYHVRAGQKQGDEIVLVEVPNLEYRTSSTNWTDEIARDILAHLESEASQFDAVQHYACYSIFSKSDELINRCTVTIRSHAEDEDDDGMISEGPSIKGMTMQLMRHLEAKERTGMAFMAQALDSVRRQNEHMANWNEKLLESRFEMMETVAQALNVKTRNEIDIKREDAKIKAIDQGIETAKQIAPVLINKLVGKQLLPEPQSGIKQIAKVFFKSFTEEQIATMVGGMNDAQRIQFFAIMEGLTDENLAEQNPPNGHQS